VHITILESQLKVAVYILKKFGKLNPCTVYVFTNKIKISVHARILKIQLILYFHFSVLLGILFLCVFECAYLLKRNNVYFITN
jgi:hypothetical protein